MKIKVDEIHDSGLSLDISGDAKVIERLAPRLDFGIIPPVSAHLDIESSPERVYVAGSLKTGLRLTCSRCLKPFDHQVDSDFTVFFVRGKVKEKEKELDSSELEISYLETNVLDTDDVLLGQIALEVPMKPLCREECKGLCPRCGADLNLGPCPCPPSPAGEKTKQGLASLKDFKVK